jgi:hypothetical protein
MEIERQEIIDRLQKVADYYESNNSKYEHYTEVMNKIYALKMGCDYELIDVTEGVIGTMGGKIATLQKNYGKMSYLWK